MAATWGGHLERWRKDFPRWPRRNLQRYLPGSLGKTRKAHGVVLTPSPQPQQVLETLVRSLVINQSDIEASIRQKSPGASVALS